MGTSGNHLNSMAAIKKGSPGDSAYLIAVKHGFPGTEKQWLSSLGGGGTRDYYGLTNTPDLSSLHAPHSDDQDLSGYATTAALGNKVDKVAGSSLITSTLLAEIHAAHSDDQDLSGKVDKVTDKSLVFDTEIAKIHALHADDQDLSGYATTTDLGNKVDKATGYSLVDDTLISEIHAPGSDNQDLSGKVDKVLNKSLVLDTDIAKIHALHADDQDLSGYVTTVSNVYTNAAATPTTIGGISSGSTFASKTMTEMWNALLYPYQTPLFTAFALTGFNSILECGVNFTGGAQTFTWTISNPTNVNANTVAIRDITNSTDLLTGLINDGTEGYTLTAGTVTTNGGTRQWGIRATDSNSAQIGYRYITTTFYYPFYSGVGTAGLSVSALQALTKSVSAKSSKTISYTTSNQKFYFTYPASYGDLSTIIDQNGYNIMSGFTKTQLTFTNNPTDYNGASLLYNVYESNALSTMGPYSITFNF